MAGQKDIDEVSGTETTGHEWDGIKELNTPLPRWWLWTFYASVAFSIVYVILYPAIPLINSATPGILGWSSRGDLREHIDSVAQSNSGKIDAILELAPSGIDGNPELRQFAISAGQAAYKVNCIQCHGAGASGGPGYPNLNDDVWIWGGDVEAIYTSIAHGIRYQGDDDSRFSEMPAFGRDGVLSRSEVSVVASYVRQLSGQEADAEAASEGMQVYVDNCAACHGEAGEGDRDLGAPPLNDALWLYGGTHEEIVSQINEPKHGVMPAWAGRLDEVTIKSLAIYVHSLGGGE